MMANGIRKMTHVFPRVVLWGAILIAALPAWAGGKKVKSQTVYVPAYSHIYHGDREVPFYLTVTLSIRNTDPAHPIKVTAVDYFDTDGKLIKKYLEGDLKLQPLASTRYVVKESDKIGGSGASFIVKWQSAQRVTEPIVETVMISTATQQGISFTSRGMAVEEAGD